MYIAIRRMKARSGFLDEAVHHIENGFVPLIRNMPGFVEYTLMHVAEEEVITINVFETQEQAEESNRRAAEWVSQNLVPMTAESHEIVAIGDIRLRKAK